MNLSTRVCADSRRAVVMTLAACASSGAFTSLAQSADGVGEIFIQQTTGQFQRIAGATVRLIRVILGLGALVMLTYAVFKLLKGEKDAAEKVAYWIVGLVVGFLFLSLVQKYIIDAA